MNGWTKFQFQDNHGSTSSVWNPIISIPALLWFINAHTLKLLTLTPHWIPNEICMADAQQQDVKEEAERTLRRLKGRGLIRQESWSHLKGCFRWTSTMEIRNPSGRYTWLTRRKHLRKFLRKILFQITIKQNKRNWMPVLTLRWKKY